MPTEPLRAVALFLFAHQDDEFGVLQRIAHYRARGVRVACAYLTDGRTARAVSAERNAESRAVLQRLGYDHPTLDEQASAPVLGHGERVRDIRSVRAALAPLGG